MNTWYRRVFKVIEKLWYCQTKRNTQVLHALVIAFRKVCPPSLIRLTGAFHSVPCQKQNFPAYLPLLTSFLVSQHFCSILFAKVSLRLCLSPNGMLNFLNTYSAIRKIRISLPWPQHEASWTFSLQEFNSLNPLGNMTHARSCIWMVEEKAIVFTLQAFLSSIPPNPLFERFVNHL